MGEGQLLPVAWVVPAEAGVVRYQYTTFSSPALTEGGGWWAGLTPCL